MIIKAEKSSVAVVGLGYVGLSVAAVLARRGARVFGIDRMEEIVASVNAGICPIREPLLGDLLRRVVTFGKLTAHSDAGVIGEADTVILTVGTPLDRNYQPDTGQLLEAVDSISPFLKKGQSVILKSTVPPGLTRKTAGYIEEKTGLMPGRDLSIACCPERLAEGSMIGDIESIPVIVGGLTPENTRDIAAFWSGMGWKTVMVSGPEEAEMSKLADNLWIDLNIALANEICMICHRLGLDVLEVINAANTLPKGSGRVNILFPGPGVGGSCLVKDPWFLHHLGRENGLNLNLPAAGRKINESMPGYIVGIIDEGLKRKGQALDGAELAVLGLSFKQNTGDTRFSPSISLVRLLSERGARVRVHDPWVDRQHAADLAAGLARVEPDIPSAVQGCHAVVIMVGHPEFLREAVYWKEILGGGCLLLDCRNIFDPLEMTAAGIDYLAPGRRMPPRCGEAYGKQD